MTVTVTVTVMMGFATVIRDGMDLAAQPGHVPTIVVISVTVTMELARAMLDTRARIAL